MLRSDWFEDVNPWNGEAAILARTVWLHCMGIPPNAWSVNTLEKGRVKSLQWMKKQAIVCLALEQEFYLGQKYSFHMDVWVTLEVL